MYVILGATGNTGSVVANKLLAKGEKVRVIGRDAAKLGPFVQKGAESFVADAADANALARAFTGAQAAYAMIPPSMTATDYRADQERTSDAIAEALEQAGVPFVVALSSFGADKAEKTGPVAGLHSLEQKLNRIPKLNALHLRAGYFMENLLAQVGVIRDFGMLAGPVKAKLALPMIATRDIGAAAAEALLALDFKGKQTRELLGQRDVSYTEVAQIIGAAIGKSGLSYSELPDMMLKPALVQTGMSSNVADLILEMADALNSGHMKALEARNSQNATPTSVETFVQAVFLPAFKGSAATA